MDPSGDPWVIVAFMITLALLAAGFIIIAVVF